MKEKMSYKFLKNVPIGKDLFEGKSQEKIANVVSNILEDENFQIIGIDGSWGTGKSNLVKIIENKLTTKSYVFFIYDVWGHQEDDQRRSILVELTEFITSKCQNIVRDTEKWSEKLKQLLSKERNTTTTNIPYLSAGFIFSLFSIIYIPTVNVFKDTIVDFFGIHSLTWKLILVTFPLIIVLLIYLWYLVGIWIKRREFWTSFQLASQETFQVYNNKQKVETKIETISENEPSVKDFRDWMKEIDKDLTLTNKKLVIVFDNFDRLPKKNIQSIWASIHIFFSDEKYKNIKVIVPFDREHIKIAFCDLNGSSNYSSEDLKNEKAEKVAGSRIDFANDYINKTFDLVYRISPPIMSDWKVFFNNCWTEAFQGSFDENEYDRVEQVYETYTHSITPRGIIAFINEIITLKHLHDTIPVRYISLFVANKDSILKNPLKAIIEPDFLKGLSYLYKDDEDFQMYITALSYQIDSQNALEVIYRKQLKTSLVNNDAVLFSEISKTNVFNKIIRSVILDIDNYINPIILLNSLSSDANITIPERQNLWDDIYLKIRAQDIQAFELPQSNKILLIHIGHKYKSEWLSKYIHSLYMHKNFEIVRFVKIIDELIAINEEHSLKLNIYSQLTNEIYPPEEFIQLVKFKKKEYAKYKIETTASHLDEYLSKITIDELDDYSFLKYLTVKYSFRKFEESLNEKIASNTSDVNILEVLFRPLKLIAQPPISLLDDNTIYSLFTDFDGATSDFYYDIVAMRLARGKKYQQSYQSEFVSVLDSNDDLLVSSISEIILHYITYDDLLIESVSFINNLMAAVVRTIVKVDHPLKTINIIRILNSFEDICLKNDLDPQILINDLDRQENPDFEISFIQKIPNFYFEEAIKNTSDLAGYSISKAKSYFGDLNEKEWQTILENLQGKEYKLLRIIGFDDWNSYSLEALKNVLLVQSRASQIKNKEELEILIKKFELARMDLTNTFKNIRDEFIINRNINASLFSFFGELLFKFADLEERSGDVVRTIIVADILDNDETLKIMLNNRDKVKDLLNSSSNESADFKEALRDRLDNEKIKEFARFLGVKRRKRKEEVYVNEEEQD